MSSPIGYFDGAFMPLDQVRISPWDAGFVYGATVSEQLRTFSGALFMPEEHWARLREGVKTVGLAESNILDGLEAVVQRVVEHNFPLLPAGSDLGVNVFVTPGELPRYSGRPSRRPLLAVLTYPLAFAAWADLYTSGVQLSLSQRIQPPEASWPRALKHRSRMHYFLADRDAERESPGTVALLCDQQGFVTETGAANIFCYSKQWGYFTPRMACVLQGVSLRFARSLIEAQGGLFTERDVFPSDLYGAEEVFLTSTANCILPVTHCDGRAIGDGRPGEQFRWILSAWSQKVGLDIAAQAKAASKSSRG